MLRELTRSTDVAARYGGDEFCLIAPGSDTAGSVAFAKRVNGAARKLRVVSDEAVRVTLSIGVAEWKTGSRQRGAPRPRRCRRVPREGDQGPMGSPAMASDIDRSRTDGMRGRR